MKAPQESSRKSQTFFSPAPTADWQPDAQQCRADQLGRALGEGGTVTLGNI